MLLYGCPRLNESYLSKNYFKVKSLRFFTDEELTIVIYIGMEHKIALKTKLVDYKNLWITKCHSNEQCRDENFNYDAVFYCSFCIGIFVLIIVIKALEWLDNSLFCANNKNDSIFIIILNSFLWKYAFLPTKYDPEHKNHIL